MENKKEEEIKLISMNEKLYSDFSIEELEQRLETDPLLLGGLFDTMGWCIFVNNCTCDGTTNCTCNVIGANCTCDGGSTYNSCSISLYVSCPENSISV
jgi:hypothetical protein